MQKNVDIKNLEKLACLKLNAEQEEKIKKSITDVMGLISSVEAVEVSIADSKVDVPEYNMRKAERFEGKKDELRLGNMTEDGYFLAPKVIKKD